MTALAIETLRDTWRACGQTIRLHLRGVSEEDALRSPGDAGTGNCLNWLVGHILVARDGLGSMLGRDTFLTKEEGQRYGRGSVALVAGGEATPMRRLVTGIKETGAGLDEAFAGLDAEVLAQPIPAERFPFPPTRPDLASMIQFLHFHESYHAGQIALVRRSLGYEGVIK